MSAVGRTGLRRVAPGSHHFQFHSNPSASLRARVIHQTRNFISSFNPTSGLIRCRPPQAIRSLYHHISEAASTADLEADIVIVGAGIIGLTAALGLLQSDPSLTVVLLDAKEPCAGATGAGQGYLWLAHRNPDSPAWEMAVRSKSLWAEQLQHSDLLQIEDVEYQEIGSMIIASTAEEAQSLQSRATLLQQAGVENAEFIGVAGARQLESALSISDDGGALIVPKDAQINGRKTAAAVLKASQSFGSRFQELFYEPCEGLISSSTGRVEGIITPLRTVIARTGVIIAAGAWTGPLLADHLNIPAWSSAFLPRRGLLLELERPESMQPLHRGLMEIGYTKHYNTNIVNSSTDSNNVDVTFTATTSASGSLLVGSSREFSGWDNSAPREILDAIMDHAEDFLPGLSSVDRSNGHINVRVGLRPYSPTGPMVGPVAQNLYVAAGHEGSGLTLGPATAELLCDYVHGREKFGLSAAAVEALRPPKELLLVQED